MIVSVSFSVISLSQKDFSSSLNFLFTCLSKSSAYFSSIPSDERSVSKNETCSFNIVNMLDD